VLIGSFALIAAGTTAILPIDIQGGTLIIAMADPGNIIAVDDARVVSGMNIKAVVAAYEEIKAYLG